MKIYINNYDFTNIDKSLKYDIEYYNDLIYTPNNILLREKDEYIWNCQIIDEYYEQFIMNDLTFIVDYSTIKKIDKIYYIPKEHFHIVEYIHEKEINNNLTFVKKIIHQQEVYYFDYKGNKESFSLEELFNFIK